jgi:hypothetical protein
MALLMFMVSDARRNAFIQRVHCAGLSDVRRASQYVVSAHIVVAPSKLKAIHSVMT